MRFFPKFLLKMYLLVIFVNSIGSQGIPKSQVCCLQVGQLGLSIEYPPVRRRPTAEKVNADNNRLQPALAIDHNVVENCIADPQTSETLHGILSAAEV